MPDASLLAGLTSRRAFVDFLTLAPRRGGWIGEAGFRALDGHRFNTPIRGLNQDPAALTFDTGIDAGVDQCVPDRRPHLCGAAFASLRLTSFEQVQARVADTGWDAELA